MLTVWKYTLQKAREQVIDTRMFAEPLSVALQHGSLVMWVKLHDDELDTQMRVWVIMTGENARDVNYANYLGTVEDEVGLVYHVFWDKV